MRTSGHWWIKQITGFGSAYMYTFSDERHYLRLGQQIDVVILPWFFDLECILVFFMSLIHFFFYLYHLMINKLHSTWIKRNAINKDTSLASQYKIIQPIKCQCKCVVEGPFNLLTFKKLLLEGVMPLTVIFFMYFSTIFIISFRFIQCAKCHCKWVVGGPINL